MGEHPAIDILLKEREVDISINRIPNILRPLAIPKCMEHIFDHTMAQRVLCIVSHVPNKM